MAILFKKDFENILGKWGVVNGEEEDYSKNLTEYFFKKFISYFFFF